MKQKKTIKIFLASSEELKQERDDFGNLIRRLADIYEERGINIKLKRWEDFDASYNGRRKQDEYNDYVRDCNLFLALFYKKAGAFTIEEFDVAREECEHTGGKPKTYVYCRNLSDGEQESEELKEFKKRLSDELKYFWIHYNSSESLHFQFVMQLLLFENSLAENLKVENGEVTLDDIPIANMGNLGFAANNLDYQRIKQRLQELPRLVEKALRRVDKYPDDEDLKEDLQGLLDEKNRLQKEMERQQGLLLDTAKRIAELQGYTMTDRMRRAIDAFENGDVRKANIILGEVEHDADHNLADYLQSKNLTEQKRKNVIQSIEELLLKTSTCMADISIAIEKRVEDVYALYVKVDDLAQQAGYEKEKYSKLLINYVCFLYESGCYKESETVCLRQIKLAEELYGTDFIKVAGSFNMLGMVYCNLGDYHKALDCHFKALHIKEKFLGPSHIDISNTYNNIGLAYQYIGDYQMSIEYYSKALELREKELGKDHPDTATTYNNVGGVYKIFGDLDKALWYYTRAKDIMEKNYGTDRLETAISYHSLGSLYDMQGDYTNAEKYLLKAIDTKEKVVGKEHPETAFSYNNLGEVYRKQRNFKKRWNTIRKLW